MTAIYEFSATNFRTANERINTVVVSLSTERKAEAARAQLIAAGFDCTPVECLAADDSVELAVATAKRILA